jgi:tripartite-type tricarboxylate transporter receptor subunit TctC
MKKIACIAGAFALAVSTLALAQSWPQRPVRLIVSLGAGSGADIGARLYADRLTKMWGQPVVVENRPGADGVLAINAVISARDDHALLWGPTSNFVGHPYTLEKLPYDPNELLPVARVSNTVVTVAVSPALRVNSLKDLVERIKAQPGNWNFATATTNTDIVFAAFFKNAGLDVQKVAYKDTVSALNDLLENRIQIYGAAYAIVRSQAQAGRVKLLAITNHSRAPGLDVPTVAELGFPLLDFDGLVAIFAARSSGLADAARDRIAADVRTVSQDAQIAERLQATAQINNPGTAAELAANMKEQATQLDAAAKKAGIERRLKY